MIRHRHRRHREPYQPDTTPKLRIQHPDGRRGVVRGWLTVLRTSEGPIPMVSQEDGTKTVLDQRAVIEDGETGETMYSPRHWQTQLTPAVRGWLASRPEWGI